MDGLVERIVLWLKEALSVRAIARERDTLRAQMRDLESQLVSCHVECRTLVDYATYDKQ